MEGKSILADSSPLREGHRCRIERLVAVESPPASGDGRQHEYKRMPESGCTGDQHAQPQPWLDFSLFRNFQRVIHLDAEVSDRTFQFGMAKQ